MKMPKLMIMFVLAFVLTMAFASANFEATDVLLGSESQKRLETITATFTITNSGSLAIQNAKVTFQGVLAKYNVQGSLSSSTIPAGGSVQLTVTGFVPADLDAVDTKGNKVAVDIGNVLLEGTFTNNVATTKTVNLLMEAENNLRFGSGSKILIEGDSSSLRNDKNYDDIKRGDSVELEIEVENRFDNDGDCEDDGSDCEIDDVEVTIESDDSDLDVDEDVSFDTIDADDESVEKISFDVADDIDDGDYDIEMFVTGDDENGARHGDNWQFTLEIDIQSDDVRISGIEAFPSTLSCTQRKTKVTVDVENIGSNDQDEVAILLDSPRLDLKQSVYNVQVDEGDETSRTFDVTLPQDITPGQYFITVISNIDNNDETDRDSVTINVEDCSQDTNDDFDNIPDDDSEDDSDNGNGNSGTDVNIIEVPPTAGVIYGTDKPEEKSFFDSKEYLMVLGALVVIALLMVLVLLAVLFRK